MADATAETHLWRMPCLGGIELLRARYAGHAFARHAHETYAVGVVHSGYEEIWFRDGVERVGPGGLVLINPEELHTGAALSEGGWAYRVMYPATETMAELGGSPGTPRFRDRVVYDRRAARMLLRSHVAAETEDVLAAESALRMALRSLLRAFAATPPTSESKASAGGFTTRARDLLLTRMVDPPSLEELAAAVGVGTFTLLRSFREAYGLPPHAYLTQARIRTARRLLDRGLPPAEVASAVGFFDQAHLSRHFRRAVGVPPGAYQRGAGTYKPVG